jgi:hypothetical protein
MNLFIQVLPKRIYINFPYVQYGLAEQYMHSPIPQCKNCIYFTYNKCVKYNSNTLIARVNPLLCGIFAKDFTPKL